MLNELKVYENLYETCYIYLNRDSAINKYNDDALGGMIHAYIDVLNHEYITNTYRSMNLDKKKFSKFYVDYYKEEFGVN